jgi:hypothetical protein
MDFALSSALVRKRALYFLLVPLLVLALFIRFHHAVFGLLVFPCTCWPFPFRCRVEDKGVRVRWFVFEERLNWQDICTVELGEDRRRGVIGKRGSVLTIERRSGSRATLRGDGAVLSELARQISDRPMKV